MFDVYIKCSQCFRRKEVFKNCTTAMIGIQEYGRRICNCGILDFMKIEIEETKKEVIVVNEQG